MLSNPTIPGVRELVGVQRSSAVPQSRALRRGPLGTSAMETLEHLPVESTGSPSGKQEHGLGPAPCASVLAGSLDHS